MGAVTQPPRETSVPVASLPQLPLEVPATGSGLPGGLWTASPPTGEL